MAERLRAFLGEIGGRLRALLEEIGPRNALTLAIVFLAASFLALSLAVVWFGVVSSRQTAEQAARGEEATAGTEERAEDFPLVFGPGPSPEPTREATSAAERRARGIPGLSEMEVIGRLRDIPGTDFRCPGVGPAGGGLSKRACRSSTSDDPAVYEVTFLMNAGAVVSVVATASDAPEDKAAEVLGRVAALSLKDAAPMDAESWVGRNISSGGQYFAGRAEVRLYGTERSRTLEIVAISPPAARVPEITDRGPESTQPTTSLRPK